MVRRSWLTVKDFKPHLIESPCAFDKDGTHASTFKYGGLNVLDGDPFVRKEGIHFCAFCFKVFHSSRVSKETKIKFLRMSSERLRTVLRFENKENKSNKYTYRPQYENSPTRTKGD